MTQYIRFLWFPWLKISLVIGYNTINIPDSFEANVKSQTFASHVTTKHDAPKMLN